MRPGPGRRLGTVLLAVLIIGLIAPQARAVVKSATVMRVDRVAPVAWGARASVTAHLMLSNGAPVADRHVDLHLAGDTAGGRTDANGTAIFDIKTPVLPGGYALQVTFRGSSDLLPSQASTTLTVLPRTFTIHTVPVQQGLPFILNGTGFVSDANGIAQIVVAPDFDESLRPDAGNLVVAPGVEERFARWRTHNGDIYATYETYYEIRLAFVDLAGNPVDPARVTKVSLKGAIGNQLSVQPNTPFTVLGQRVVPLAGELQTKDVGYSVEDVVVDGASVVHRAQNRFTPSLERTWTITLLFYSAHVLVRDAIFGFPLASELTITYPDGHEVAVPTKDGELSLTAMARGNYSIVARGWGISFSRPVALSRDQDVDLKVITYLDLGVVVGLVMFVVFGLLLVGRPGKARGFRDKVRTRGRRVVTAAGILTAILAGAVARGRRLARGLASGISALMARPTRLAPSPAPAATPRARPERRVHVVRAGDTLESIAAQELGDENAWTEILHANGDVLFDSDQLVPGTRLRIP